MLRKALSTGAAAFGRADRMNMALLFLLLGCIIVADYAMRLPARRVALGKARTARKAAAALARSTFRAQVELWIGLGIIAISLLAALGH